MECTYIYVFVYKYVHVFLMYVYRVYIKSVCTYVDIYVCVCIYNIGSLQLHYKNKKPDHAEKQTL